MIDITVRGAGIFGLCTAWVCASRGARVQVLDPHGPGAGSSGGIVGALAPHVPEKWNAKKAFQLESLLMARDFWSDIEQAGGATSGYARCGRLQPIADDHMLALARQRAENAQTLWQGEAVWEVIPSTDTLWEPNSPTGWLIHDTLSALMHPRKACDALVKALAAQDVPILTEAENKGQVLWATGVAGLEALNINHHRQVGYGVKGQAALLHYDARNLPQLFANSVHVIPHGDGTVAIGSTSEREYTSDTQTDDQLEDVICAARKVVPALHDAPVIDRWAGVRPRSRNRAPILGAWPNKPGHFVANGGFKIGFGMAPKAAHVMADLLLDGVDTIPEGFRVTDSL